MAQNTIYKPFGSIEVFPDTSYTAANIPASANITILQRGVRILDENGSTTPIRGVRVSITPTGVVAATSPLPSVPFIWRENDEIRFDAAFNYKFYDRGIVAFGIVVTV